MHNLTHRRFFHDNGALMYLGSFLTSFSFCTRVNGVTSLERTLTFVYHSMLFSVPSYFWWRWTVLLTNTINPPIKYALFADGISLFFSCKIPELDTSYPQAEADKLTTCNNGLQFSPDKSSSVHFCTLCLVTIIWLFIPPEYSSLMFLAPPPHIRLIFDEYLNWKQHTATLNQNCEHECRFNLLEN